MYELKDYLNAINFTKQNLLDTNDETLKKYPPFVINKCLSVHYDCIAQANEMNELSLPRQENTISLLHK